MRRGGHGFVWQGIFAHGMKWSCLTSVEMRLLPPVRWWIRYKVETFVYILLYPDWVRYDLYLHPCRCMLTSYPAGLYFHFPQERNLNGAFISIGWKYAFSANQGDCFHTSRRDSFGVHSPNRRTWRIYPLVVLRREFKCKLYFHWQYVSSRDVTRRKKPMGNVEAR